jgi:cysteine desulfurase/selenocysteine lyase
MLAAVIDSLAPRAEFPVLLETVFLDTANDGLVSLTVRSAAERFWRASAAGSPDYGAVRAAAYEGARDAVARLLGADRSTIAVTNSASEAMGQVAWALRPGAGANVVLIDADFPTATYPWLRLAAGSDVELRFLAVRDDPGSLSVEALAELVDEHTAVVSVSHVQYATGQRLDVARLSELAHRSGALVAVDVAQSAGVVPIDVQAAGVDVVVGHAGKWLCGETGAGFCYLRPGLAETIDPPILGWRSTADPWDIDGSVIRPAPDARRLEVSSISYLSRFVLGAAIDYLLGFGIEAISAHDLRLGALLADGLDALGATVLTPRPESERAGIVAARFPGSEAADVARRLAEAGVRASARLGAVRFSTHLYNNESDVVGALDRLERLLAGRAKAVAEKPMD